MATEVRGVKSTRRKLSDGSISFRQGHEMTDPEMSSGVLSHVAATIFSLVSDIMYKDVGSHLLPIL